MKIQKKTGLRVFDLAFIRSKKPCYDPNKYLPENWRGTAIDVLGLKAAPEGDRLWVVLHPELISERLMRLFAVWCYRQTLIFLPNQDPRCIKAADVAEAYANGKATKEELAASYASVYCYAYKSINTAPDAEAAAALAAPACTSDNASSAAHGASHAHANAHASAFAIFDELKVEREARVRQVKELSRMILAEGKERLALRKKKKV